MGLFPYIGVIKSSSDFPGKTALGASYFITIAYDKEAGAGGFGGDGKVLAFTGTGI